jgi:hypothetical protein
MCGVRTRKGWSGIGNTDSRRSAVRRIIIGDLVRVLRWSCSDVLRLGILNEIYELLNDAHEIHDLRIHVPRHGLERDINIFFIHLRCYLTNAWAVLPQTLSNFVPSNKSKYMVSP